MYSLTIRLPDEYAARLEALRRLTGARSLNDVVAQVLDGAMPVETEADDDLDHHGPKPKEQP